MTGTLKGRSEKTLPSTRLRYLKYQPSWQTAAKRKQAVAKLLGDFLVKEDPSHPYADLVAAAVLKYRYSMEIPLSTL